MKLRQICVPTLTVMLLAACGGDDAPNLSGMYAVTHHTLNDTGCDVEGADATDFDYFQLTRDSFLGTPYLSFGSCDTSDPATCDDFGLLSAYYQEGSDWTNTTSWSTGGGANPCNLGYNLGEVTDLGDGAIRIVTRSYSEEDDTLSEAECDPDTAKARGTSMPCVSYEVLEAQLVD